MNASSSKSGKTTRTLLGSLETVFLWLIGLILLAVLGFARYSAWDFFAAPVLTLPRAEQMPYEISKSGSFVMEFDRRMKKETVEKALKIEPAIPYSLSWEGKKLFLKPKKLLEKGASYTVSLSLNAQSFFGKSMERSLLISFEVGDDPKLLNIFPKDGIAAPDEKIILIFSHPMISEGGMELSPFTPGQWSWRDPKVLVFTPEKLLPLSTRFHLRNTESLTTHDGTKLNEKIDLTFETKRLSLIEEDSDTEKLLKRSEPFQIRFDQEVETESLRKNMTITISSGKKVEYLLIAKTQEKDQFLYSITASVPWYYDETYMLSISEDLMPRQGNVSLGKSFERKFFTESIFADNTFEWSKTKNSLILASGKISFSLKEDVPLGQLKAGLSILPQTSFQIKKTKPKTFEISFEKALPAENIKLYLSAKINGERQKLISRPLEFSVEPLQTLALKISETEDLVCIESSYPLTSESIVSENEKKWRLKKAEKDECEFGESAPGYLFEKQFLEPGKETSLKIVAEDIFGQKTEQTVSVKTRIFRSADVEISSPLSNAYTAFENPSDLSFPYTTKNVDQIHIQVCKLSSDLAIQIEGTYEEKWNTFVPDAEECQRYKSFSQDVTMQWGKEMPATVRLSDLFDQPETGLYFIRIASPSFFDEDGRSVQTSGVLNFTRWKVFSKRGESALVWITENGKPVTGAGIKLYASDGSLLKGGRTDSEGLIFLEKNRLSYEFITATKGEEDIVLNAFARDGFEPPRYDVSFDTDENPYRYQFFVEKPNEEGILKGHFIFREKEGGVLKVPNVTSATVTLSKASEELLWRKNEPVDEFGNLFFEIKPPDFLSEKNYQLGVCLGLHEGVCHGTNLWTTITKDDTPAVLQETAKEKPSGKGHMIVVETKGELSVGQEKEIKIQGLVPGTAFLFTAERDKIFVKKIITPQQATATFTIPITEEMIPEVMFSVVQFAEEKTVYDLKSFPVQTEKKKLALRKKDSGSEWISISTQKPVQKVSELLFISERNNPFSLSALFHAFYPKTGTSIITSALGSRFPDLKDEEQTESSRLQIPELVWVEHFLKADSPIDQHESIFRLAHDQQGNFGAALVAKQEEVGKKMTLQVETPEFIRHGDQVILQVQVRNNSDEQKNLQLVSSSADLHFLTGESLFLGVPAQQKKQIALPTSLRGESGQGEVSFRLELRNGEIVEDEFSGKLPVMKGRLARYPDALITSESAQGMGKIQTPGSGAGAWDRQIIVSPSPLTYALHNLQLMLEKETITFPEMMMKAVIEANYSALMKSEGKMPLENLLAFLQSQQKSDDPALTSWMANSVSRLEEVGYEIPELLKKNVTRSLREDLDQRANERIQKKIGIADLPRLEIYEELLLLNALSSLTPSGVSYANSWFLAAQELPTSSLVLLLLTLEDFRDAGIVGMNVRIEDLIQMLKSREQKLEDQVWLPADPGIPASDFLITSWYLEALVRQASARSDLPFVITWLVNHKYQQEFTGQKDQFAYLESMASYLRIYQEQSTAKNIEISFGAGKKKSFEMIPGKSFQSFSLEETLMIEPGDDPEKIQYETDQQQPIFVEVNTTRVIEDQKPKNNGLSIAQNFVQKDFKIGQKVRGEVSIISPEARKNVLIAQPIISGARSLPGKNLPEAWEVKTFGSDETWYLIPELPAGETVIPFEWELTHEGIFTVPQIPGYAIDAPATLSTSNTFTVEIRGE